MPELDLLKGIHIYTVSELNRDIKIILENTLGEVWVEGEISGISKISSGTIFFTLKDQYSRIKCVLFGLYQETIKFNLLEGLKVLCFGKVGVYEKEGRYELLVKRIEPKGLGALWLRLEELKQKLEKEGLFDLAHKRPIPYLPTCIGVVTSLFGAAIKDILKVLEKRFKGLHIIIAPVRVQGENAKYEIAQAIKDLNLFNQSLPKERKIQVMIVGRGGGSLEDLWAFNEEVVLRAIYESEIPVISAVGHQKDFTLADLVADLRAATPSQAAELVIPKKEDLKEKLDTLNQRLKQAILNILWDFSEDLDDLVYHLEKQLQYLLEKKTEQFHSIVKKLKVLNPRSQLDRHIENNQRLLREALFRIKNIIETKEFEFKRLTEKVATLNPLNVLGRGYSITFKLPEERVLKDINEVSCENLIKTKLYHGQLISKIIKIEEKEELKNL